MDEAKVGKYKRLEELLASASEVVQVEYRRRNDQAYAVVHVAKEIWEAMEERSATLKRGQESKWRKVWTGTLFFGGAILNWLVSPQGEFKSTIGTAMMICGALAYALYLLEAFFSERRLQELRDQETYLLTQWLSTGATSNCFWNYRQAEVSLSQLHRRNERERKDVERALVETLRELQLEMREDHFRGASGWTSLRSH